MMRGSQGGPHFKTADGSMICRNPLYTTHGIPTVGNETRAEVAAKSHQNLLVNLPVFGGDTVISIQGWRAWLVETIHNMADINIDVARVLVRGCL